jgi:hypothetical protein
MAVKATGRKHGVATLAKLAPVASGSLQLPGKGHPWAVQWPMLVYHKHAADIPNEGALQARQVGPSVMRPKRAFELPASRPANHSQNPLLRAAFASTL